LVGGGERQIADVQFLTHEILLVDRVSNGRKSSAQCYAIFSSTNA
jgi:hypothetical protein